MDTPTTVSMPFGPRAPPSIFHRPVEFSLMELSLALQFHFHCENSSDLHIDPDFFLFDLIISLSSPHYHLLIVIGDDYFRFSGRLIHADLRQFM